MIPYGHQSIDDQDAAAVLKTLKSDWLTQGPKVLAFEKALAKYCGAKYAVSCSSGTAALHLAYLTAGLKKGDEVITTPNTFVATSNMLLVLGAKPIFGDIRLDSYNLNEAQIEKLITKKTRALTPVDFAGQPCDYKKLKALAKKHKLIIIEDACHALGARLGKEKIGNGRLADLTVFSFHPVKSITTGEGGAVLTNNKKYYEKLKSLRSHGIYKDSSGKNVMVELGYNYRLTDIQAALGIEQLKKLDSFIRRRRQVVAWYEQELKDIEEIIRPAELKGNYSSWHLYVIRVKNLRQRDALAAYLKANGVAVNFHYPAVYSHPYYRKLGYGNLKLANEEIYHQSAITLPCFPDLPKNSVKLIGATIKNFFNQC